MKHGAEKLERDSNDLIRGKEEANKMTPGVLRRTLLGWRARLPKSQEELIARRLDQHVGSVAKLLQVDSTDYRLTYGNVAKHSTTDGHR